MSSIRGKFLVGSLVTALAFGMAFDAEAKRMGGSRSMGKQSESVTQRQQSQPTSPTQQAQQPAQQAAPASAGAAGAAAAAAPKRNWGGILGGIAAGLGIGWLLSHFGLGGAALSFLSNLILIAIVAFAVMWLIRKFRGGSQRRLETTAGVDLVFGEARFVGPRTVEVRLKAGGTRRLSAEHVFINTGCRPARPALPGLDGVPTLDSSSIMELEELPSRLLVLGVAGFGLALSLNVYFFASALFLWIMGVLYNVPPFRTKEWPYVDVLSESVNNPIRLLLGWFALITAHVPPLSLAIAYWMLGAFFMGMKRFAEFRHIADPRVAAAYRGSFAWYTEERLLVSLLFYATTCTLFGGIFIVRYHLELLLFAPVGAGVFAYYLHIGLKPNSPVQHPEKLYRERGFFVYMVAATLLFVLLMFTSIPSLYELFNVAPARMEPLWTLGGR